MGEMTMVERGGRPATLRYEDVKRYGGEYDGYWLSPAREAHLRAEDARGLRLGIFWLVEIAFLDKGLVWC